VPANAPSFPAAVAMPWLVVRIRTGKISAGYTKVVVLGPNSAKKYVAPNSSRNGSTVVVAAGMSHKPAKAAAMTANPPACISRRPILSMVKAASR
jgi:hypothetical protein